ncbi:MAG: phosphatase PAP2 family protein [Myxococcales bacterium]|nr:phosphatase PAP2 family protein [Myxococcales bacterium]
MTARACCLFVALVACAVPVTTVQAQAASPEGEGLRWTGARRVGLPEYAVIAGAPVLLRIAEFAVPEPTGSRLGGGVLFDDDVRAALRVESRDARDDANLFSDASWLSSMAYPFVDALVVAWLVRGSPDVAFQLVVLSAQSFAITAFVTELSIHRLARERPGKSECALDSNYSETCAEPSAFRSLPSGHTSGAFTGAALACAHHLNVPLYGDGLADVAACGLALAWASAGGVARIMTDRHWASDVLLGAGIGLSIGWLLPELVYYTSVPLDDAGGRASLTPVALDGGVGLVGVGQF